MTTPDLSSRCGEIRKKNISKLWILVMMTNVGGGLPGGGDGILHRFELLNIWMVRHEKGVRVQIGPLNRCAQPVSPSQRWAECWEIRWEIFCPYSPYLFLWLDSFDRTSYLWNIISTFYYMRVRPQCGFSILGRGPGRRGYWVKNMITHCFLGQTLEKIEFAPFEKFREIGKEEARLKGG